MPKRIIVALLAAIALIGCGAESEGHYDSALGTADANASVDAPTAPIGAPPLIEVESRSADFGDISLIFRVNLRAGEQRTLWLEYSGCEQDGGWSEADTDVGRDSWPGGRHEITWYSWEQVAGCQAEIRLRFRTEDGQVFEAEPFILANIGEHSGFVNFPAARQGIQAHQFEVFETALEALIGDESTDFVATRRGERYEVHAARGSIVFARRPTARGYAYDILETTGVNPIANQDAGWIPTYEEQLAAGENPNGVAMEESGYAPGDARLSFIPLEEQRYPFGYERIAAYFDHPNAADLLVSRVGYTHAGSYIGDHGALTLLQSRTPLLFWGAGVDPGPKSEGVRQVDIAPTIAALLALPETDGIDERGILSRRVRLTWQDGRELTEVLDGTHAERVFVIVFDGLTHTELLRQVETLPHNVPNLARLVKEGALFTAGATSNWPSSTYASHNTIASGLWSGHHGVIDNSYFVRDEGLRRSPISDLFRTAYCFDPAHELGENLFTAVQRVFGRWDPETNRGAYTASLYSPAVFGADTSDLELVDRSGEVPFPPLNKPIPPELPVPFLDDTILRSVQQVELMAMTGLFLLLTNGVSPPPTFVMLNFPGTDACGHRYGPHGGMMEAVLGHLDKNLGVLLGWLDDLGLAETTALVITSDHGMELGDPSRAGSPLRALDAAGVGRESGTGHNIYLID